MSQLLIPYECLLVLVNPIHGTRAQNFRLDPDADNWLVTNTSICTQRSPGYQKPALGSRERAVLFCCVLWSGNKVGMKGTVFSLHPGLFPPTLIKLVVHNSCGRGDESSHGEPTLHLSMCLFKWEVSFLEQVKLSFLWVRRRALLFPDESMWRKNTNDRARIFALLQLEGYGNSKETCC